MTSTLQYDRSTDQATASKNGNVVPTLLSLVALSVSLFVAWHSFFNNPLGKGRGAYDFRTPEAALFSYAKIQSNNDYLASLEPHPKAQRLADEKLSTLEIHKDATYHGNKILFISYEQDGVTKYDTESFTQDELTGHWRWDDASVTFDLVAASIGKQMSPYEQRLKAMIDAWKDMNEID